MENNSLSLEQAKILVALIKQNEKSWAAQAKWDEAREQKHGNSFVAAQKKIANSLKKIIKISDPELSLLSCEDFNRMELDFVKQSIPKVGEDRLAKALESANSAVESIEKALEAFIGLKNNPTEYANSVKYMPVKKYSAKALDSRFDVVLQYCAGEDARLRNKLTTIERR
jgi:hypothetical protein